MKILVFLLALSVNALALNASPIDGVVSDLSKMPFFVWQNGVFPKIDLPASASPEQVARSYFQRPGKEAGKTQNITIEEVKAVTFPDAPPNLAYTAVLCKTGRGRRVLLLHYSSGWITRSIAVK